METKINKLDWMYSRKDGKINGFVYRGKKLISGFTIEQFISCDELEVY